MHLLLERELLPQALYVVLQVHAHQRLVLVVLAHLLERAAQLVRLLVRFPQLVLQLLALRAERVVVRGQLDAPRLVRPCLLLQLAQFLRPAVQLRAQLLVLLPVALRVDLDLCLVAGRLVEQLAGVRQLVLVDRLQPGHFPGGRLLEGGQLEREA